MISLLSHPLHAIFVASLIVSAGAVAICETDQCTQQALTDLTETDRSIHTDLQSPLGRFVFGVEYPDGPLCKQENGEWFVTKPKLWMKSNPGIPATMPQESHYVAGKRDELEELVKQLRTPGEVFKDHQFDYNQPSKKTDLPTNKWVLTEQRERDIIESGMLRSAEESIKLGRDGYWHTRDAEWWDAEQAWAYGDQNINPPQETIFIPNSKYYTIKATDKENSTLAAAIRSKCLLFDPKGLSKDLVADKTLKNCDPKSSFCVRCPPFKKKVDWAKMKREVERVNELFKKINRYDTNAQDCRKLAQAWEKRKTLPKLEDLTPTKSNGWTLMRNLGQLLKSSRKMCANWQKWAYPKPKKGKPKSKGSMAARAALADCRARSK